MPPLQRLSKLRGMSAPEIRTRLSHHAYVAWERRRCRTLEVRDPARLTGCVRAELRGGAWRQAMLARPFLPAGDDREALRSIFLREHGAYVAGILRRADDLLAGRLEVFGETVPFPNPPDWHRDPRSGTRWPMVYQADVSLAAPFGDPKDTWEINRHQHLIDLARAWWFTHDDRYARRFAELVTHWIASNPFAIGINWAGPLEVAYRALSWLWAHDVLRDWLVGQEDFHLRWLGAMVEHARFLHRHLEWYASPYNHLIGEAATLYVLGHALSEMTESSRWTARGRRALEARWGAQFHADGGSVEQATGYHHATATFLLLAALSGRARGDSLPAGLWGAIERATDFSMRLQQPDGQQPPIGDNDNARPVLVHEHVPWDFRYLQAAGAVLFERGDFKAAASGFPEEALWLLGSDGSRRYRQLPDVPSWAVSSTLAHAGYTVLRTDSGDYVTFDHGEQAAGLRHDGVPSAAHGHADALAITAWLSGAPILVDAGFYTYGRDEVWERHFRSTAAHNTVRIGAQDQAVYLGKMTWCHVPRVSLHDVSVGTSGGWASASHDGYSRLARGLVHTRTVWLRRPGLLGVLDRVGAADGRPIEISWQFPPGVSTVLEGNTVEVAGRFRLSWQATATCRVELVTGGSPPSGGWVAPALGLLQAAPRLVITAIAEAGSFECLTTLRDLQARAPVPAHGEAVVSIMPAAWAEGTVAGLADFSGE